MFAESLLAELKSLPENPGVYQYFDSQNKLLYVGKAKNLKKRVRSYFSFQNELAPSPKLGARIAKMISETSHLEFIITNSEADALILENSFIKQLHPKYNILLRDDKTYPYIYVDLNEDFPMPAITRKLIKKSKIRYFGPFFKGAKELLNAIYLNFKLKQKKSCKKACIYYQISRCLAPCENKISKSEYELILKNAINALLNPALLLKKLEEKMLLYAQNENYEEAALLRDSIATIKDLAVHVQIDIARLENFDIIALANEGKNFALVRFVVQNGKIISLKDKIASLKNEEEVDKNELYKQFILENFSPDLPLQSEAIYLYEDFEDRQILEHLLSQRFKKKLPLKVPLKGEKRQICDLAFQNANLALKNYAKKDTSGFLRNLQEFFEFQNLPQNIEVFDNSQMQGVAKVGAMVVFENGDFVRHKFRLYHLEQRSEYEQMRELLTRRAMKFGEVAPPDLWVIDGGATLLKLAKNIIESSGANVDVIAISKEKIDAKSKRAKGGAKDLLHTTSKSLNLSVNDSRLLFFQKLRDEAHRFAISFHQKTKKKLDLQSSILKQNGVSDGNIIKLLNYFGSFEKIYSANFEELSEVLNTKLARKIQSLK